MKYDQLEKLYLKSLDSQLSDDEQKKLALALAESPDIAEDLQRYSAMRVTLQRRAAESFGPYFASKVIYRIQNAASIIDREIFGFFKRFQLAAMGIVIALVVLNIVFTQGDLLSALGLGTTSTDEILSFDYYDILNESL